MTDLKVVMLVGNTGVGKSSLGCRLLGTVPRGRLEKPFKIDTTAAAVTTTLQEAAGSWFGQPAGGQLTVVDTPGLADPEGAWRDATNMDAVGNYMKTKLVTSVLFVLDAQSSRINLTLSRLMQIIIAKVHQDDYDKLAVVINRWSQTDAAKQKRASIGDFEGTETDYQQAVVDKVVSTLKGHITDANPADRLDITSAQAEAYGKRVFFVDSHHTSADGEADHCAINGLMKWCKGCEPFDTESMSAETGDIYPEWQAAEDRVRALQEACNQAEQAHQQRVSVIESKAAAQRTAMEARQAQEIELARVHMKQLEQQMQAAGAKAEENMNKLRQELNQQLAIISANHKKAFEDAEAQREAEKAHEAKLKRLEDEKRQEEAKQAGLRYQELSRRAALQYQRNPVVQNPSLLMRLLPIVASFIPGVGPVLGAVSAAKTTSKKK